MRGRSWRSVHVGGNRIFGRGVRYVVESQVRVGVGNF